MSPDPRLDAALTLAFREEWGRVVATMVRLTGDWAVAEDCAQEAFAAAATAWARDGVPERPGAWLTTTARNRALDRLRRASTEARKLRELPLETTEPGPGEELDESSIDDDVLRLIFTCAHPALAIESRVALTLRTLCGLSVAEIARAFGSSEAATDKRLVRSRAKVKNARIPYRVPPDHELPERLAGVLAVLYVLFAEGYHLLPAAQADLLRRAGRPEEAAAAYRRALETVSHAAEREYLERRLAEVSASSALDPTQPNRDPAAFSLRSPSPGPGEGEGGSR